MYRWAVCLCVASLACPTVRAEEKIPLEKLPKAVVEGVKKKFPRAKLVGASKETEDKKLLYEVTIKDGEQNIEVTLTAEGEIVEIEKEIASKDLPREVKETLDDKYPKATIKKAEEITKGKVVSYEVLLVTREKKNLEVKLDAKGKVTAEEKKGDADE